MPHHKKLIRNERGQAMVEAALVVPLLIFLLFTTMIFGMMVNARIVVTSAAREGARQMALFNDQAGARQRVEESMAMLPNQFNNLILFNPTTDIIISDIGQNVEVIVRYRHPTIVPFLPTIIDTTAPPWSTYVTLVGSAVHRKEFE
jgi:Flp pilus assembly protein TadG